MKTPPPEGMLSADALAQEVRAGRIHTVVAAFPDWYGRLVGKQIHARFFVEEVLPHGMHACNYLLACDAEMDPTPGYAFTNWQSGYGDLHCTPDLQTLRRLAWREGTALVLCDCRDAAGAPLEIAPRTILQRQREKLAARGYNAYCGNELEFYLFNESYATAREKNYTALQTSQSYVEDYHVLSSAFAEPLLGNLRRNLDASGIPVEFSKGEWGPGQHEINLRYAEALEMADRHVAYQLGAKEMAAQQGRAISFMAKWNAALAGSGLHIHLSLRRAADDAPVFAAAADADSVSAAAAADDAPAATDVFRHWLGGLLRHARELALFFAPTPNSYKRFQAGSFAPTAIAWSWDNRTAGFRVVGRGANLRVETRIPGADANPYLAEAALIAAGLDGLERKLEPGAAFRGDSYAASELPRLPRSLPEAIAALEGSKFARAAFGETVVAHLLHFARSEQGYFDAAVTDWEKQRYFERV